MTWHIMKALGDILLMSALVTVSDTSLHVVHFTLVSPRIVALGGQLCYREFSGFPPHSTQRRAEQLTKHELATGVGFLGTKMHATAFLHFVLCHPLEPRKCPEPVEWERSSLATKAFIYFMTRLQPLGQL